MQAPPAQARVPRLFSTFQQEGDGWPRAARWLATRDGTRTHAFTSSSVPLPGAVPSREGPGAARVCPGPTLGLCRPRPGSRAWQQEVRVTALVAALLPGWGASRRGLVAWSAVRAGFSLAWGPGTGAAVACSVAARAGRGAGAQGEQGGAGGQDSRAVAAEVPLRRLHLGHACPGPQERLPAPERRWLSVPLRFPPSGLPRVLMSVASACQELWATAAPPCPSR